MKNKNIPTKADMENDISSLKKSVQALAKRVKLLEDVLTEQEKNAAGIFPDGIDDEADTIGG